MCALVTKQHVEAAQHEDDAPLAKGALDDGPDGGLEQGKLTGRVGFLGVQDHEVANLAVDEPTPGGRKPLAHDVGAVEHELDGPLVSLNGLEAARVWLGNTCAPA